MSVRNTIDSAVAMPEDFLEMLIPSGIKSLLALMCHAYFDLLKMKIVNMAMDENDITEEWFVRLLLRWKESNIALIPVHEKLDKSKAKARGKPPTIDFCFRSRWDKRSYFGAECKLIEANNEALCDKYVREGMKRYIDGIYAQSCPESSMLGYIRQTKCSKVAEKLRIRINALEGAPELEKSNLLLPFEEHYVSKHKRVEGLSPFTIHHLLFLFTEEI